MARIRTVKPELFHSESLALVSLAAERTFVGLLTQADDHGRLRFNSAVLNGALWPLRPDHTAADLQSEVADLVSVGALCQYEIDGKTYLHFPTWNDHQKISHPSTRNQSPPCPRHEPSLAQVVVSAPKAPNPPEGTGASPAPSEPTRPAAPPDRDADDNTEEEASDMGIYDQPVDAFAELHPVPKKKRTRKKAADSATPDTPTPSQITNSIAQDYYDSINGLGDFQKIRSVVSKAVKAGYAPDRIAAAMRSVHESGRPLTAEVLSQFLEGYARNGGRGPDKTIHYAADKPRESRDYREEL